MLVSSYLQLSCVGLFHDTVANIAGTVVNVLLSLFGDAVFSDDNMCLIGEVTMHV